MSEEYALKVERFVKSGARLIRQRRVDRYGSLVPSEGRPLEPGFIPPHAPAKVLIVSYFPNETDLDAPHTLEFERVRNNFATWGERETIESYETAYRDWLGNLGRIPFHTTRTKPILESAGVGDGEFAWLPFVKAPMKAGSSPGEEIISKDKDETWQQIFNLKPEIVWIQGHAIANTIKRLVEERVTDQILPVQSLSTFQKSGVRSKEMELIAQRLREYLGRASARS